MFGIEKHLNSRIVSFFRRRGFDAAIGRVKWRGSRLTLDDLLLEKTGGSGESIRVERLDIGLHLWRSVIHLAIEGGLTVEGLSVDLRVVSDAPLSLHSIEAAFRFGKKRRIAQLNIAGITLFLRGERGKTCDDFYLQIPPTAWDDLVGPLRPYLRCPWVKEARSDSKIALSAFFQFSQGDFLPFSWAKIEWDGFYLNSKNPAEEPIKINRDFLLDILDRKLGIIRNRQYLPFGQLPQNLVDAIVCCEDPRYWSHSGVCLYGLGIALRENTKTRKFARGASTITMQVARNLFLTHNRNLVRKTEEVMIALLLENYFKIDKKEIFELYANLIEFAPGVYGVTAASRFYFGKELSELTLTEILVLTYITPRPKHFYEALLERTEQLRQNLRNHIGACASTMTHRGLINPSDQQDLDYCIRFAPQFGTLDLSRQI